MATNTPESSLWSRPDKYCDYGNFGHVMAMVIVMVMVMVKITPGRWPNGQKIVVAL